MSLFLLPTAKASAQMTGENGRITARILEEEENAPIEYASVVLHRHRDSSMVRGTVSNEQGHVTLENIPPGRFYLSIHFLGYEKSSIDDIRMEAGERRDLGDLHLRMVALEMDEVEVAADRAPVEYKIDKKVINVDRQLTAASGTAADALKNVPSVTVDIDGSVSLRGSGSFTVLIDGQPSALDASDALQQIPASSIENIEIITNPSARYDPDGVAGIINVIMKKDQRRGSAGQINLSAGTYDNYRGDFLYTWRNNGYALHFGADYGKRNNPGIEREERVFFSPESTMFNYSEGSNYRRRKSFGVRGGIDMALSERDQLNLGVRLGDRSYNRNSELDYEEWIEPGTDRFSYLSLSDARREGRFYALDLDYRHRFDRPQHELTTQIAWRSREAEERNTDELRNLDRSLASGRRATEDGPGNHLRARLDYTLPFNE
ncbi:MAG: TonB-dependent receptor, partial [Bacteroidetes bacterium]|nr:TonB-dependent receptor [Bacteroidota bacterium]